MALFFITYAFTFKYIKYLMEVNIMGFLDIFNINCMKNKISRLESDNEFYIKRNSELERKLNHFKTLSKLNRLIELPRQISVSIYVIMNTSIHVNYDKEIICMRRSSDVEENNIMLVCLTISKYILNESGLYIGFKEQYGEYEYFIKSDSCNLFLNMDDGIAEIFNSSDKTKYYSNDPFVQLYKNN